MTCASGVAKATEMLTFVSMLATVTIFVNADDDEALIRMVPDDESLIPEVKEGQNDVSSKSDDFSTHTHSPAVSFSFSIPEAEVRAACLIPAFCSKIFCRVTDRNISRTSCANKLYGNFALRYLASYTECFERSLLTRCVKTAIRTNKFGFWHQHEDVTFQNARIPHIFVQYLTVVATIYSAHNKAKRLQ